VSVRAVRKITKSCIGNQQLESWVCGKNYVYFKLNGYQKQKHTIIAVNFSGFYTGIQKVKLK